MKILTAWLALMMTLSIQAQTNISIVGVWNGGLAFDGTDEDSLLLFRFEENGHFHFNYGVNHDFAHVAYEVNNDTLIVKRNDKFQDAYFQIVKLTEAELHFRVLNRPALHIVNTLCSPYNHAEYPLVKKESPISLENLKHPEVYQLVMELDRYQVE